MAKKDSDNVFAASAKTAEKNMKKVVDHDEEVAFTVRMKSGLHKKARYYSIDTGESMNSLR